MRLRAISILIPALLLAACGREAPAPAAPASPAPVAEAPAAAAPEVAEIAPAPGAEEVPVSTQLCALCHGDSGPSPFADLATIQGLPADAIENALYDFRAGTRPCRKSQCSAEGSCPDQDMCMVASRLSDEAITELSQWYAARPFVAAGEPFDAELAALGATLHEASCESCHSNGGVDTLDASNRLRGQHKAYLRNALEQYRSGERLATGMMYSSVVALSEQEIDALLEFYASPLD